MNDVQGRCFVPSVALVILVAAGFPYVKRWPMPVVVGVLLALLIASTIKTLLLFSYRGP